MYDDQQSYLTDMRAGYGDMPPGMYGGGGGGGYGNYGDYGTSGGAIASIGSHIRPVTYTPPARSYVGAAGQYMQETGFFKDLYAMLRVSRVPPGITHSEYMNNVTGDFGERVGGGMAAAGLAAGGLALGATAGSVIMGGIGGALGSVAGPMGMAAGAWLGSNIGGYMLGMSGATAISEGLQERRAIQGFLESTSSTWVGAGSSMGGTRSGAGLSAGSRREITDFMSKMDIGDTQFNMKDLTSILEGSSSMGLFTGTTDMEDFKRKFKDITENVRTVTKVLHQTLQEGLATIKDLRGIGVGADQAGSYAIQASTLGKVAGRTGGEMLNLGLQGAEMFRGTGVDMSIGYQASVMNLASVRAARDAGILSQEAVAQAGGEEALSQRMTASGLMFSQSGFGRGYTASFWGGKGGDLNAGAFYGSGADGGGLVNRAMAAAHALGTPQGVVSFQANQEEFMSNLGKQFGGQGFKMAQNMAIMGQAKILMDSGGASNMEDAIKFSFQQAGISNAEMQTRIAEIKNAEESFRRQQEAAGASRNDMAIERAGQNFALNRLQTRIEDIGKGIVEPVIGGLNEFVDNTKEGIKTWHEEQFYGVNRANTTGLPLQSAIGYEGAAPKAGAVDLNKGGAFATTPGEAIYDMAKGNKRFAKAIGFEQRGGLWSGGTVGEGDAILKSVPVSGGDENMYFVANQKLIERYFQDNRRFTMSSAQAKNIEISKEVRSSVEGRIDKFLGDAGNYLGDKTLSGRTNVQKMSGQELVQSIFGKSAGELSTEEFAAFRQSIEGTDLEDQVDAARQESLTAGDAVQAAGVSTLQTYIEGYEKSKDRFVDLLPGKAKNLSDKGIGLLINAVTETDPEKAKALRGSAIRTISKETGMGTEAARTTIGLFAASGVGKGSLLDEMSSNLKGIEAHKAVMGGNVYRAGLIKAIESTKGLSEKERNRSLLTIEKITDSESFMSLSKEEINAIPGAAGAGLKEVYSGLKDLEKVSGGIGGEKAAKSILSRLPGLDEGREDMLAKIAGTRGGSGAVDQVFKSIMSNFSPDSQISSSGGTEAGEDFTLQTNINRQILSALTSMNSMFKSNK